MRKFFLALVGPILVVGFFSGLYWTAVSHSSVPQKISPWTGYWIDIAVLVVVFTALYGRKVIGVWMGASLLVALVLVGCDGSTTTTITERIVPQNNQPTDPAIVDELAVFQPNENGDMIELTVEANSTAIKSGDTLALTNTSLHVVSMVYGFGVVGKDARTSRANITDIEVDDEGAVEMTVAIGNLPKETLKPAKGSKEVVGVFDVSSLAGQTVDVSVSTRVDPTLAVVWAARRLGLKPMPSTGGTVIERTTVIKKSGDSWIAGVAGFVLGVALNAILPGSGVTVFCPDPVDAVQFKITVPAAGGGTTPPPVEENQPPKAVITATPISGNAPLTVTLNASDSSDPDGSIVKYEWDFDGNGVWDLSGASPSTTRNYPVGTFVPRVRVTDNVGATDIASTTEAITVTAASVNQSPTAVIVATPTSGYAPLTVSFDGSDSYDPDGTIVGYLWSYDDGGGGNGVSPTHVFQEPGTYDVVLTVTDNDDAQDTDAVTITVTVVPPDDWTGVVADIRPNSENLRTLSKSTGEYQEYNVVVWLKDGAPVAVTPDEIRWSWDEVVYGTTAMPAVEVQTDTARIMVYSAFAALGDHTLAVELIDDGEVKAISSITIVVN